MFLTEKGGRVSSKTPVSLYSGSLTSSSNGFGFDLLVFGTDTKTKQATCILICLREREKKIRGRWMAKMTAQESTLCWITGSVSRRVEFYQWV